MAFIKKSVGPSRYQGAQAEDQGRSNRKFKKGGYVKKKVCRFCADKLEVDYRNISLLRAFITANGKILSGHITGTCAKHQRKLGVSIKRARMLALLPFTSD